jgi:hypothetical protein
MTGFDSKQHMAADKQEPVNLLEARRIATEYGTPDSQVDNGNLYFALSKCLEHIDAQPAQEPVTTVTSESGNPDVTMSWWHEPPLPIGTPLYTYPPQRPWVGLTDEELKKIWYDMKHLIGWYSFQESARATEAKLKERNS